MKDKRKYMGIIPAFYACYEDDGSEFDVVILKAPLTGRFSKDSDQIVYQAGGTYGDAQNPLELPESYQAAPKAKTTLTVDNVALTAAVEAVMNLLAE